MPKSPKSSQRASGGTKKYTILVPADWEERIDAARGDTKPSDFIRDCIRLGIDDQGLSEMGSPGRRWPGT